MLRKAVGSFLWASPMARRQLVVTSAALSSNSDGDDSKNNKKDKKEPSLKDILGEEMLDAVNAVSKNIHATDGDKAKSTRSSLLERLISHEKETFTSATADQTAEMLADEAVASLLNDVQTAPRLVPRAIELRKRKRGLLLLRREVFYQAIQSGYSSEKARKIAEDAVVLAEKRVEERHAGEREQRETEKEAEGERSVEEEKLYAMAYEMAEKMLYGDEEGRRGGISAPAPIEASSTTPSFLAADARRLGIFTNPVKLKHNSLGFWREWDQRAANIWNLDLGPRNAFEEQIEWTKAGKQWPFPINNEYMLGEEETVPFYEHIFVDRLLEDRGLPTDGPIPHFLHLVAVGLSKNPHMTVAKKRDHIEWFVNFFNKEKQELIAKLHAQEQATAAAAN